MGRTRSGSTEPAPSRFTLGRLPGRVVLFLQAVARYPALRAVLAEGGYRRSDHEEGRDQATFSTSGSRRCRK